ncbi:TAXI family TRAP transporter solute-binding subunit [Methylobacterium iners]|uniref:C4-dicarboxylate ABC transporter substrate-binding protein n=1 Tax=Methylobacterium iners TaxID=418707 RepID=A0ABQ4RZJ1_9HYPH|nr:TAXI family TRAP transporter solute-binding subunit [Methylobacterium iners]GJD95099.1 hypothetical protein OCOJLMKI_2308 [Methylobacterium iners]
MSKHPRRREFLLLAITILLVLAAAGAVYLSQATTLTVAVAPSGGTEPALIKAYAEALTRRGKSVRLKILPFDGVRESAEALQAGKADLAVVRPDVFLPQNGLTLAILRDQALIIAAPSASGIDAVPGLAGKRLGTIARRGADQMLIKTVMEHYGLSLLPEPATEAPGEKSVALVPVEEDKLAQALADKQIDAVALLTTPTTPAAQRIVGSVGAAGPDGKINLFGVADGPALIERFPRLQAVTVAAGLFGGDPRTPESDLSTLGASYRLMARSTLSRSVAASVTQHLFEMRSGLATEVPAANYVLAPSYDTTAAATSARLPIHPGAIDYYEREQQSFIERYETWIYLVAFLGGGVGSALAWLRQRVFRLRRERIEVATERLLDIQSEARSGVDQTRREALASEIDDLAAEIVRHAVERPTELRTIEAAAIAVDTARSTVRRASGEWA